MSVIFQLGALTVSQGWHITPGGSLYTTLTNSGTENAQNVYLKVTDSIVFDGLAFTCANGETNALNVFTTGYIMNRTDINYDFPAGTTKTVRMKTFSIKAAAPIQTHNLICTYQYIVY